MKSNRHIERKLAEPASTTGRPADALVQNAVAGYLGELADVRETLERRYDDLENGYALHPEGGAVVNTFEGVEV